ncbi:type I-E CRISPR-associated protein Cas6/Cse3/CasE [Roseateles amylovorans]|uniref:Type I-E CRISPR-associated protein Cas6/Cse3/CasE n=1 Tax=Roseateles amylovorans TaxID=2978473 RepID=A0ABY6AYG4_9BURK|nr:type I-E CRISPR-associated protein Cas6/Cse3/CasE [Roseateles amylovorans]UXH76789.1 type I-E CRISPR-associated protein Cas6/Cse3/CasE [Roseateles amylovorans]
MYLTQLRLDPRSPQARRDLANAYDMHRTLVRGFVREEQSPVPRFLWRLETNRAGDAPVVLVQSSAASDWSFMSEFSGYLRDTETPVTKSFDPSSLLQSEKRYRFRLVANPTVTRQGQRHGLVGEDMQLAWLHRQGERHGFTVEAAMVSHSDTLRGRKAETRVSLLQVQFDGVLRVGDPAAVVSAVASGIGHGKAFGCGLLSLARCP